MQVLVMYHSHTGNTEALAQAVAKGVRQVEGVDCVVKPASQVTQKDFLSAQGVIAGSPVYFGSATPQTMAMLDRVGYVARKRGNFLRRKVGAAIAVARRAGQNFTFAQLNYFFLTDAGFSPTTRACAGSSGRGSRATS